MEIIPQNNLTIFVGRVFDYPVDADLEEARVAKAKCLEFIASARMVEYHRNHNLFDGEIIDGYSLYVPFLEVLYIQPENNEAETASPDIKSKYLRIRNLENFDFLNRVHRRVRLVNAPSYEVLSFRYVVFVQFIDVDVDNVHDY